MKFAEHWKEFSGTWNEVAEHSQQPVEEGGGA